MNPWEDFQQLFSPLQIRKQQQKHKSMYMKNESTNYVSQNMGT
jgi:hypothetical protein